MKSTFHCLFTRWLLSQKLGDSYSSSIRTQKAKGLSLCLFISWKDRDTTPIPPLSLGAGKAREDVLERTEQR